MIKILTPLLVSKPKIALILLSLLYIGLAFAHAYLAPLTTGPDELAHYEYVNFIATHERLPLTISEREQASYKSDQPPLFHLLTALPTSLIDPNGPPFLKRVRDHARRQLIERTRHAWGLYNTEDEQWPYRGEVLRWQMGRWVAILFGLGTVMLTFFIARFVLGNEWGALSASAIVAFTPRFVLTGSMLNYETTGAFFSALFLWTLLRLGRGLGKQKSYFLLLGLFAGLAITTKLGALILPVESVIAFWFIKREHNWSWLQWGKAVSLTLLACLLAVSWWFGFIVYQFNTVAQDGWWVGLLRPLIAADASDATTNRLLNVLTEGQAGSTVAIENLDSGTPWAWAMIFFRTFWVVSIEEHQPGGWVGLIIALLMVLVAMVGLIRFYRHVSNGGERLTITLLLLHLIFPIILPLLRYAVTFSLADTAQGRHVLFMAAPAFAILLVRGIHLKPKTYFLPPAFLFLWTVTQLWYMTWAYRPLLPVSTTEMLVPHQMGQSFNKAVTLLGYDTQPVNHNQLLEVDLFWRAKAISPLDYLTEVTLHDAADKVVAQWVGYSANGRYPTRAWDVGDTVRDTAWLPLMDLSGGHYTLKLNLHPTSLSQTNAVLKTPLTLTMLDLSESKIQNSKSKIQVWRNGQAVNTLEPFNYLETVLVTFDPTFISEDVRFLPKIQAIGFTPVQTINNSVLFIVGPNWPTADYRLQISNSTQIFTTEPMIKVIDRWQRQFVEPPISHRVEANFANQIKLLGYDLGNNRTQPGGGFAVTLYWQGVDWLGYDLTISAKPIAVADQTAYGGRDRLPMEGYRTLYWAPDEIITDPFGVPVSPNAPDGIYQLYVGLYRQVGQNPVALPLVSNGHALESNSVTIGPLKVGHTPPGLTIDHANPEYPLQQPFGDAPNLTLLGYDLNNGQGTNDNCPLTITLYWRAESILPVDYTTFVHLRNAAGEVVAQKDGQPLNGAYPTSLWEMGEIIADKITIPMPTHLSAGKYSVVIGMYNLATGARLVVPDSADNSVVLREIVLVQLYLVIHQLVSRNPKESGYLKH